MEVVIDNIVISIVELISSESLKCCFLPTIALHQLTWTIEDGGFQASQTRWREVVRVGGVGGVGVSAAPSAPSSTSKRSTVCRLLSNGARLLQKSDARLAGKTRLLSETMFYIRDELELGDQIFMAIGV